MSPFENNDIIINISILNHIKHFVLFFVCSLNYINKNVSFLLYNIVCKNLAEITFF